KYKELVDKYAHQQHWGSHYTKKTYFRQNQYFLQALFPINYFLGLLEPANFIFAAIKSCIVKTTDSYDIPYYPTLGAMEVVDTTIICVQCIIGRVQVDK
ncbi:hypothetical protein SERLA73DRAFT_44474, partial [Serpula lacrymans var. lacrymans S7.3]